VLPWRTFVEGRVDVQLTTDGESTPPRDREDGGVRSERPALLTSAAAAAVLGSGAVVWGLVAGSGVILFDGVYALAGIALVAVSLLASRAAESAPDSRYPFGRHAATPLAVAMQGAALGATFVYAVADATGTLLAGGSEGDPRSLLVYGLASGVASTVVVVALRRAAPRSQLVQAEVVSWRAGAWLSCVVAVGGVVGIVLEVQGQPELAAFVDPVLLLFAVGALAPLPVRLVREGMHEVLEGAPPPSVAAHLASAVSEVRERFRLPEPVMRATKLGRRLYVEVDFVVPPGTWDVDDEDSVRRALIDRFGSLPYDVWATVEVTSDPELAL
jgi:predicted Co/Zn/Cd cation transporter (cation efflux family)